MERRLTTVGPAAKMLKMSVAGVVALERRGLLRALRTLSGVRLFNVDEVMHLAARRRAAARIVCPHCGGDLNLGSLMVAERWRQASPEQRAAQGQRLRDARQRNAAAAAQ